MHRVWAARRAWRRRLLRAEVLAALSLPLVLWLHPAWVLLSLLGLLYSSSREESRALTELDQRYGLAYRSALEAPVGHPWRERLEAEARTSLNEAKPPAFPWAFLLAYAVLIGSAWLLPEVQWPWGPRAVHPVTQTGSANAPSPDPASSRSVTNPQTGAAQGAPSNTPTSPQSNQTRGQGENTQPDGQTRQSERLPSAPPSANDGVPQQAENQLTDGQNSAKPGQSSGDRDQHNGSSLGKPASQGEDSTDQGKNPGSGESNQTFADRGQSGQPRLGAQDQAQPGRNPPSQPAQPRNPLPGPAQSNPDGPPQTGQRGQLQGGSSPPGQTDSSPSRPRQGSQDWSTQNGASRPGNSQPSSGSTNGRAPQGQPDRQGSAPPDEGTAGGQSVNGGQDRGSGSGAQAKPHQRPGDAGTLGSHTDPITPPSGAARAGEASLSRGQGGRGTLQKLPNPWQSGSPPQNVQRRAENYLESEPLPPELRDVVRRYFELPENP